MREIEFRGKSLNTGLWVFGLLMTVNKALGTAVITEHGCGHLRKRWVIDLSTVGQYTGLKDALGNEIYEGDIVKIGGSRVAEVYWSNEEAQYIAGNDGVELSLNRAYNHDGFGGSAIEIIGNIHDNKLEDFYGR